MKILWITNTIFPAPSKELGLPIPVVGGWMYSLAVDLRNNNFIKFAVATVYNGKKLKYFQAANIEYYLIPKSTDNTKYDISLEKYWVQIKKEFRPDVVHIHGTEYAHGLAYIKACGNHNCVVSIQGLISVCARYYNGGLSFKEIIRNITFRDIVKWDNILQQQRKFYYRGNKIEKQYLHLSKHIIGRTSWDNTHIKAINPKATYHLCNETLRQGFYKSNWEYEKCDKYSIFLSQGYYPLKGLHQLITALPFILRLFPETKVYIAGEDITCTDNLKKRIRLSGYGKYIRNLIKKFQVEKHITFTGTLTEVQMVERYLKSNVFVCPSSIENSPNSLGEAQLLGVPVIASYVGGIPDMVEHRQTGFLYRFEEFEMLAEYVCTIFSNVDLAKKISINEIESASNRHNKQTIVKKIHEIYKIICT